MIVRGQRIRWVVSKTNVIGFPYASLCTVGKENQAIGKWNLIKNGSSGIGSTLHPGVKSGASSALRCAWQPSFIVDQIFYLDLRQCWKDFLWWVILWRWRARNNLETAQLLKNIRTLWPLCLQRCPIHPTHFQPLNQYQNVPWEFMLDGSSEISGAYRCKLNVTNCKVGTVEGPGPN